MRSWACHRPSPVVARPCLGALRGNHLAHVGSWRSLRQPHPVRHRSIGRPGTAPYSSLAAAYFTPFDFSSRGPLAGLASAPVVLAAGGRPPDELPNQPWTPFDPQGFMAFRIAAMVFASTAFLSLWTLIRSLGGRRAARFGLLLAATTPFLVHEVWFTWPKLFAASFVLLAVVSLIRGYPLRAGLLGGTAYLVHPGALLYVPVLCLLALWPLMGARLRRPQLRQAVLVLAGAAICLVAWRVINGFITPRAASSITSHRLAGANSRRSTTGSPPDSSPFATHWCR